MCDTAASTRVNVRDNSVSKLACLGSDAPHRLQLAATKDNWCVPSSRLLLGQKVALERTTKTAADSQSARVFFEWRICRVKVEMSRWQSLLCCLWKKRGRGSGDRNSYSQLWLKKEKSLNNLVTSVNVPVFHMYLQLNCTNSLLDESPVILFFILLAWLNICCVVAHLFGW